MAENHQVWLYSANSGTARYFGYNDLWLAFEVHHKLS
jgi:2-methylcitrate dehydratase PrpD